jgi:hypothetical protein
MTCSLAVEGARKEDAPEDVWHEPPDSEDDAKGQEKAIKAWEKCGFTFEGAKARAGAPAP